MKRATWQKSVLASFGLTLLLSASPTQAQITPDTTVGTEVRQNGNLWQIRGGQTREGNLFHSFQQFSVPISNTAFFQNSSNIVNIINRVTGNSLSNINGLIRANGGANLILINPNGIRFGANAKLDIGGSFLGTTASSIKFADGTEYSALDEQTSPLLTVSVPIGLQLGQNSKAINVEGTGHNLSLEAPIFSPFTRGEVNGLKVKPGNTLGLVGGDITLQGGTLTAEEGRIELGSVNKGLVNLNFTDQGFSLDYQNVDSFKDINLRSLALVDTSGNSSGSIQLQGRQISLADGSAALIANEGENNSGVLRVNATKTINLIGTNPDATISSGLYTEALGSGDGGNINLTTQELNLKNGGLIIAETFTAAKGGNIRINASKSVEINGFSPVNPGRFSSISAATFGSGNAGNLRISTQKLTARDGGNVASVTGGIAGTGSGGDVFVNAKDSIELIGVTPEVFTPSQITAGTGSSGNAGTVTVKTQRLVLQDGGRIDASTLASGDAGSVTINASKSIEVNGTVPGSLNPSLIISSANIVDEPLRQLLQLPPFPSGNSGNLTINTPELKVINGGRVTVSNQGVGDAGSLDINANSIFLGSKGSITGTTIDGSGGNIQLNTRTLKLNNGLINASVFGSGSGGEINIEATESLEILGTGNLDLRRTVIFPAIEGDIDNINLSQGIVSSAIANGKGGDVNINTGRFTISNGGLLATTTFGNKQAGSIFINVNQADITTSLVIASTFASGNAGDINVDTEKFKISGGGQLQTTTFASGNAGNLIVRAQKSVELVGRSPNDSLFSSGLTTVSQGQPRAAKGNGGNLTISTPQLTIKDGAEASVSSLGLGNAGTLQIDANSVLLENKGSLQATNIVGKGGNIEINTNTLQVNQSLINASALGKGTGGNIEIKAPESVQIVGSGFEFLQTIFNPDIFKPDAIGNIDISFITEGVLAATAGEGSAGKINIETGNLQLEEGGLLATATIGKGNAGSIFINAPQFKVDASVVSASTVAAGNGGDVVIDTGKFTIEQGAQVLATALDSGNAGNLTVNASEVIEVSGISANGTQPTNLAAGVQPFTTASGNGGNLTLNTPQLNIEDGAAVSVNSVGIGNAGTLQIKADSILVDSGGVINAASRSGQGGNIRIQSDNITWRGGSQTTAAAEQGSGGNIFINADSLVALESSEISANAFGGSGGNIQINTQGIFTCPECQITASSNLGVDGTVEIITPKIDTNIEIFNLPPQLTNPEQVVALQCSANRNTKNSEFAILGRGSLPSRPTEPLNTPALADFEASAVRKKPSNSISTFQTKKVGILPPPALGWYVNAQGVVVLSAEIPNPNPSSFGLKSPNCQLNTDRD